MMQVYTVSFFGHRRICDPIRIERRLEELIKELLVTKQYVEFLVGRDGDFDLYDTITALHDTTGLWT